jgi:uracil-DNA glycosylase
MKTKFIYLTGLFFAMLILTAYDMNEQYFFPFGSKLKPVIQTDRTPKKVFVLGVYASAVHAKWLDKNGKLKIRAMAVASEPYIFWRGDNKEANDIISQIKIPNELGTLVPCDSLNGPSGKALDELYLKPLGYSRTDAWLCDLLPFSCINPSQKKALEREYEPLIEKYNLNQVTVTPTPTNFASNSRMKEIIEEIKLSKAKRIILLGDQPIKYLLSNYSNSTKKTLSEFGKTQSEYGKWHKIIIDNEEYEILPLVHPRQAAALGTSDIKWNQLHNNWIINLIK